MNGKTGWAYTLAVFAVVLFGIGGLIVGGFVGNLIAPARLDWSGLSTPGLLVVGAILGLVGGVSGGIWIGVRVVRDAKTRYPAPPLDPTRRRRRRIAVGATMGLLAVAAIVLAVWPRPICEEHERGALVAVSPFDGTRAPVEDMPIEAGATAPGGCQIEYTIVASADEVAGYYANELYRLGWRDALAETSVGDVVGKIINDDPYRLWIHVDDHGLGDTAWDGLHYDVVVTDLGDSRVLVETAVAESGHPYG